MAFTTNNFTQDQIDELVYELVHRDDYAVPVPVHEVDFYIDIDGGISDTDTTAPHKVTATLEFLSPLSCVNFASIHGPNCCAYLVADFMDGIWENTSPQNNINLKVTKISEAKYIFDFMAPPADSPRGYIPGEQVWNIHYPAIPEDNTWTRALVSVTRSLEATDRAAWCTAPEEE